MMNIDTAKSPYHVKIFMPHKEAFGKMIKEAIFKKNIKVRNLLTDLKKKTGIEVSHVSFWSYANGKTIPRRLEIMKALEEILDVEFNSILCSDTPDIIDVIPVVPELKKPIHITQTDDGKASILIDAVVEWDVALKVLALIKQNTPMNEINIVTTDTDIELRPSN